MNKIFTAIQESKNSNWYLYGIIFTLLLFFHFQLILTDPLLLRDDLMLVGGVDNVSSMEDYWQKLTSGYLWDLQPIRDLTFYLNLKLYYGIGYGAFHLTNLLLGGCILVLSRKILYEFKFHQNVIFLGLLFVAAHPVFNSSIAWVSNRKHLLAVMFILGYFLAEIRNKVTTPKSLVLVLLSYLSQPITIFMAPIWIVYKKLIQKRKVNVYDSMIFVITFAGLILNQIFYSTNERFAGRNLVDEVNSSAGLYILKMARTSVQVLFPVSLGAEYDPGNLLSILGIVLTVLIIFLLIKLKKPSAEYLLYLIPLSALFPVLKWGPRDPYLLTTLLLTSFFICSFFQKFITKKIVLSYVFLLLCFSVFSYKYTNMWKSDLALFQTSYEAEGGADNMFKYAIALTKYESDKAFEIIESAINKYPTIAGPTFLHLRAYALFKSSNFSSDEKLRKFRSYQSPDIYLVFYQIKVMKELKVSEGVTNAEEALKGALRHPFNRKSFTIDVCPLFPADCKALGLAP